MAHMITTHLEISLKLEYNKDGSQKTCSHFSLPLNLQAGASLFFSRVLGLGLYSWGCTLGPGDALKVNSRDERRVI